MKGWMLALHGRFKLLCGPRNQWFWVAGAALLLSIVVHNSWLAPWLESAQVEEVELKKSYVEHLRSSQGIAELERAKVQMQELVTVRERQLPSQLDVDALLSDVNMAALGRGLTLHRLERTESPDELRDYYRMFSFTLVASGPFTDVTDFLADVANLSRIVTLHHLHIAPVANRHVRLEATLVTYAYLTVEDIAAQRARAAKKGAGKQEPAKQ